MILQNKLDNIQKYKKILWSPNNQIMKDLLTYIKYK